MLRVSGISPGLSILVTEVVLTHAGAIGSSASTGMRCSGAWMREPTTRMRCYSGTATATRMRWCSGTATATKRCRRVAATFAAASRFFLIRRGDLWRDQHQGNTNTNECSHEWHLCRLGLQQTR
jgi:hypothetical protein